jgi:hypothetical protein
MLINFRVPLTDMAYRMDGRDQRILDIRRTVKE